MNSFDGPVMLVLPFPLRLETRLLAHVTIPSDLTTEEADRLCNFIKTFAQDKQQGTEA